jgi:hypothetical protein
VAQLLHHRIARPKVIDRSLELFHPQACQDIKGGGQFPGQPTFGSVPELLLLILYLVVCQDASRARSASS